MAEQAHFAKYKISLKNNNKESQQVNEPTSQRGIESTSRRCNRSTRTWGARNSRIRNNDSSKIRGFKNSWRWIDKKRRRNLKNFSSLQLFNHFFSILLSVFEHRQPKDWSCYPFSGSKVNCHLRYQGRTRFQHTCWYTHRKMCPGWNRFRSQLFLPTLLKQWICTGQKWQFVMHLRLRCREERTCLYN